MVTKTCKNIKYLTLVISEENAIHYPLLVQYCTFALMLLTDTHIHLDDEAYVSDLAEVMDRARTSGVRYMLVPNVDTTNAQSVTDLAKAYPGRVFAMMGLHPTSIKGDPRGDLDVIRSYLGQNTYVAIGEIGIDLYWDKTWFREQQQAFVEQMHWARELGLCAVIHSRKSLEEIILLIKKEKLTDIPAVFHCFPGSVEQALQLTDMGYKLGIGGVVTFKNAGMAEVVRAVPLESLLTETDAPWLSPVPHRGQRNEPGFLRLIAAKIAEIKETTPEEVASVTSRTAAEFFTLPVS